MKSLKRLFRRKKFLIKLPENNFESETFERFQIHYSIQTSLIDQKNVEKSTSKVTGMGKFRKSQKLKRQQQQRMAKKLVRTATRRQARAISQPTFTVKNYTPYDV